MTLLNVDGFYFFPESKTTKYSFDSDEGSIKSDSDEEFVAVNNEVDAPKVLSSEDEQPVSKKWVKYLNVYMY